MWKPGHMNWLNWPNRYDNWEVISTYSPMNFFRMHTHFFLLYPHFKKQNKTWTVVLIVPLFVGSVLITGLMTVLSSSCIVLCCSSGTDVAWHSHRVLFHPTQSTRCQLRLGLMNKFMRCKGFVRMCGHRGMECWIQTKCHMSLVVLLWGQSGCWYLDVATNTLQELCMFWFAWQTSAYWFHVEKKSACHKESEGHVLNVMNKRFCKKICTDLLRLQRAVVKVGCNN